MEIRGGGPRPREWGQSTWDVSRGLPQHRESYIWGSRETLRLGPWSQFTQKGPQYKRQFKKKKKKEKQNKTLVQKFAGKKKKSPEV